MAIGIASIVLILTLVAAYMFSRGKSKKTKYIAWGITTMFVINPLFSWIVSILYGIKEEDGFAAVALMMVMLPLLFMVGLIILLIGILKNKQTHT